MELAEALGTDHVPGWNALLARVRELAERDRNSKAALLHAMKRTDSPAWSYLMERVAERFSTTEDQRIMVAVEARETAIRDEIHAALGSPEGANRSRAELVLAVQEVAARAASVKDITRDLAMAMGIGESGDWSKLLDVVRIWRRRMEANAEESRELLVRMNKHDRFRDDLSRTLAMAVRTDESSDADLLAAVAELIAEVASLRREAAKSCDDCGGEVCKRCEMCHECSDDHGECQLSSWPESAGMDRVVESLTAAMTTDPRDWSLGKVDAWIYAVIVGWDLEGVDADVADRHNWNHDVRLRLAKLHAAVMAASRGRQ